MRNTAGEQQLIDRMQSGDAGAVADLSAVYGARIHQLAFRYMKNWEDAEEVTQDVLMKVFRKIDAFRGDAALSSWIYRITFNTAMSRLRTNRLARSAAQERDRVEAAQNEETKTLRARLEPVDWSSMPDEELLRGQLRSAVADAIAELPEIYRAPVVLRDIEGLSTEEASNRLHLMDQTLKSRLHRGRVMLRRRLQPYGRGLSLHRPSIAAAA